MCVLHTWLCLSPHLYTLHSWGFGGDQRVYSLIISFCFGGVGVLVPLQRLCEDVQTRCSGADVCCVSEPQWIPWQSVSAAHAHTTNRLIDEELLCSLLTEELVQVSVSQLILHQPSLSVHGPASLSGPSP